MALTFTEALTGLMAEAGRRVDENDEHARLSLYQSVLGHRARRSALLSCLALDPDPALATSVLASLLEAMPPGERHLAVSAAPTSGTAFLTTRAEELAILDQVTAGLVDPPVLEQLVEGSDWLQRRASERAETAEVLSTLADRARTRKVRARAAERARLISPA